MEPSIALALLLVCAAASASHLRKDNICGKPDCIAPHNFRFSPEIKYWYQYEARVDTVFDVEKNSPSSLHVKAQFELQFSTPCHGYLKVSEVTMSDSVTTSQGQDQPNDGGVDMESYSKHVLRFYYEDGKFRELCPEPGEPVWILNYKKGILSALQNSMERLDLDHHTVETDVNGECLTEYKLEAVNGTTLVIGKQKHLESCTNRHQLHSILPTGSYIFQTKQRHWNPMVSSLKCQQFVDHHIVTSVECTENHSFLPFYNQSLGASTSARLSIQLVDEEDLYSTDTTYYIKKVEWRTSLLFDTRRFSRASSGSLEETSALIVSMCRLNTDQLQPQFSEVFNKFIHVARYLPYQGVSQLYNISKSLCPSGKKHMLDGLPHLRSSASVLVMKDIIVSEDLPPAVVNQFLFAMSLFNRPEAETVDAVGRLLLDRPTDAATQMAVSALLHSYCKQHQCQADPLVQRVLSSLEQPLHQQTFPDDRLEPAIVALKAIGNAGVETPTLVATLQRIIARSDLPLELRIASIDAHRRLPCGVNQEFLLNCFRNVTNDEEIRIKAYMQVVKCPSLRDTDIIVNTLLEENNYQVGSFVWSHLQNIKVSAMPSLMEVQAMLQNKEFSSKFNKAYLKYSRNYESSFYINEYGVGGFIVTDVIFSHKSYIPRTISSNVTVMLFGEAVNVAEITLNLDGFEQYAEALFWNNGILSKFEKTMGILRFLRSSQTTIKSKIDALPNVIADSFAIPKASLAIRIFGNEMQYSRVSGKEHINNLLNNLNPLKIIKDFLSGQEIKVEKSMLVCDARYETPLSLGLPLHTDAVITSTVKLDLAGFINATAFTEHGLFDIEGKLKPSIAINMVGAMGVDAYYNRTEVKVVSKVYTSTAVQGSFKLKSYKFARISLNIPLKKSEIFSINSHLMTMREGVVVPLEGLTAGLRQTRICSWSVLDDALGLVFCIHSLLPDTSLLMNSPMVIFNGPLDVEVTLDKSDPSTQVYTLEYNINDLGDKTVVNVVFDTPGSTVKRGLTATLNLDRDGPNVTLVLQTTRTQLKAQGFYRNTPDEVSLSFWLDMNGRKHIDLQLALSVKPTKHGKTYEPTLQFLINDKRIISLSGSFKWVVKNDNSQCEVNLDFRTNRLFTNITGYVRKSNASLSTNLKLGYRFENMKPEHVRLELLLSDKSAKQISKLLGKLTLQSSSYPQVNTLIHLNFQKGYGHVDCKAVIKTNPVRLDDYRLVLRTELEFYNSANGSRTQALAELKRTDAAALSAAPGRPTGTGEDDLDLKLSLGLLLSSSTIALDSVIRYSKGKEITLEFDLMIPKQTLFLIDGKLKVTIPNTSEAMVLHALIDEMVPQEYDIELAAVWFSGHNVTVRGSYQCDDRSVSAAVQHLLKVVVRSPLFPDVALTIRLHLSDTQTKAEILVNYNDGKYGLKVDHASQNPAVLVSNGELNINSSTYTISNYIDMASHQASMELHLDQYRDIHIKVSGPLSAVEMKATLDIKWDANRDPSQKLLFIVEALKGEHLNYQLTSVVEYPGRVISSSASLIHNNSDYTGIIRLEWSPGSAISVSSFMVLDLRGAGKITLTTTVLTPFENWTATHLKYGLWVQQTCARSNASLTWGHDGLALFDVRYDSLTSSSQVGFSITTLLNSTVKELSPLRGQVRYTQSSSHIGALLDVQSSEHRVMLEAGGQMTNEPGHSGYSAHLRFNTPFQNLTKGQLSGNIKMDVNNNFDGGSVIALNDRNITTSFEGTVRDLNESKLLLKVYTPFQRYKKVTGKFSFSSSNCHLMVELKASAFKLGFKTIYVFRSMQDFDLQLSAMTGVSFVSSFLLVGTLNNETVDFRGGWNSVVVGLTGRSHYSSWRDLEYRGELFMPFEGFRESGAIAKFLYTDRLHLELIAAVAKAKVGLKVASMWNPDEEFGVSETESVSGPSRVLWRALFALDTLYQPTATGHVLLATSSSATNDLTRIYTGSAALRLNALEITLQDVFRSELQNIANDLVVTTNNHFLSEMRSKFELKNVWPIHTAAELTLNFVSKNNTYKFDMDGQYQYQAVGDVDNEGFYSASCRLITPFKELDHCYFEVNLLAENYFFSSNMTIDVVDNRISVDGMLEVDEHYFGLTTDFSVASSSFSLPFCHISFIKDFSAVEKNINITLKYPNKHGAAEHFEVGTFWHFGGEQFIKTSLKVVTPFKELEYIEGSFLYSSEPATKQYNLELFFKTSHDAALNVTGKTQGDRLYLVIESSQEKFREVVLNGTLKQESSGALSLDSVVSSNQAVRMDLQISSSQGVPLYMNVWIWDNSGSGGDGSGGGSGKVAQLSVEVRRKRGGGGGVAGYDLLAVAETGAGLEVTFQMDLTSRPAEDEWKLQITSNHDQYKEVNLTMTVIPGKDQIFEISIQGHTDSALLTSNFDVVCNMWFDGKKGRVKANLESNPLSGDSYLEWEWEYLRNMKGLANASYTISGSKPGDFSTQLYLGSPAATLTWRNLCLGADLSLDNKEWWFHTNVTVMAPSADNLAFTSFLVLPHDVKEVHSLVGKLHYTPDYKYINQVLKYSALLHKLGLHTSIQMKMSDGDVDGSVLVEGGYNGAYFFKDNFNATFKDDWCDLNSIFTSSFTSRDQVIINMHYEKPQIVHKITVDVNSPGHGVKVMATMDFETINNMQTNINCTTPLSTFPHIGMLLQSVTNQELYNRYGQLLWPNNSAMFNCTDLRSWDQQHGGSTHEGTLLLDFPLATRHTVTLAYTYQENNQSSSGISDLLYNEQTILQGNFSRQQHVSDLEKDDLIRIHVTNVYMPLGLNYRHKLNRESVNPTRFYVDKKRVEIFKVEDEGFNVTGEIYVAKTEVDHTINLNLMHLNRSLVVSTVFCANKTLRSTAHISLKPSVWASTNFYLYRKQTTSQSAEHVELGLSYPHRNLTVSGGYEWGNRGPGDLHAHLTVQPSSDSRPVVTAISWQLLPAARQSQSGQQAILLLSHPSLEKNVTLSLRVQRSVLLGLQLDMELDYARLSDRRLSFSGRLCSELNQHRKHSKLTLAARHPITRFHMEMTGAVENKPGFVFAFKNFSYARSFLPLQYWNSSVKLDINDNELEIQRQSLRDLAFITTKYTKQGTTYNLKGNVVKGKTTNISGNGFIDFDQMKTAATVNLNTGGTDQLLMAGGYYDHRHALLEVWRRYDDLTVRDASFSLRLNHSRLLTANCNWRTSIRQDIIDGFHISSRYVWNYVSETAVFWTDFMKTELSDTVNEIWFDAEPVVQEFIDDVMNVDGLKSDMVYFQTVFNESYEANEFYMQDIYNITLLLAEEIAFRDKMGELPKIVSELWQVMGETGESVRQSILYLIETVKAVYMRAVAVGGQLMEGDTLQHISHLIGKLSSKYDKVIKDMHVTFVNYVESLWAQIALTLTESWNRMLQVIEPAFIEFLHYVDFVFWDCSKKILEFLYQKQNMILSSANLAKDSNFTKDMDKILKDITKNGILSSAKNYTITVFGMIKDKYFKVVPFGYELTEISSEIYGEIKELYKLPAVNVTIEASAAILDKTIWLYEYFDIENKLQLAIPFIYNKVVDLSHTALQNEIINHKRKTKFIFESRRGELLLEQQLPVPWHSFNHVPHLEEIKEYKMMTDIQKWLTPSNNSFWSFYYQYSSLADYRNWLPPYKGEAIIGRNYHFVTFDKVHYSFRSPCSYLLAKDFVRNDFALALSYSDGKHLIQLYTGPYLVEIDLHSDTVSVPGHDVTIPANLNGTLVSHEFGIITVASDMGFSIICNVKYDSCTVKLSGWYFGKTAGLLGTLDNEPSNEWQLPNGHVTTSLDQFTAGWLLLSAGEGKCAPLHPATVSRRTYSQDAALHATCDTLFASRTSHFSSCFPAVDPKPYHKLCHKGLSDVDNELCTPAIMYIQECHAHNVPLRTPNICVRCQLYSNSNALMTEGDFTQLRGSAVPQSSDVVFILEAKACNDVNAQRRNLPSLATAIAKALADASLTDNRFGVVVFGGDDVFDEPRSLLAHDRVFGTDKQASQLLSQIPIGNGNSDIFRALRFATKLQFRAGVSKTFILLPCSQCAGNSTTFDYSALNEVLTEKDITLHIIMNNDFGLEKTRSNRLLYGVDSDTAYTKSDFKRLRGDQDLRRQVKLTRQLLGLCTPLALDTNGTIFSGQKLEQINGSAAKKFVSVFGARVAASGRPSDCQNCECAADENGIDSIDCVLCAYPTPTFRDFEITDNASFLVSLEDPTDIDYIGNDNL